MAVHPGFRREFHGFREWYLPLASLAGPESRYKALPARYKKGEGNESVNETRLGP